MLCLNDGQALMQTMVRGHVRASRGAGLTPCGVHIAASLVLFASGDAGAAIQEPVAHKNLTAAIHATRLSAISITAPPAERWDTIGQR